MSRARDVATQGGLVLLNKTDFTTAAEVIFNNIFSSIYDNYRLIYTVKGSSGTDSQMQFRQNGNNLTTSYTNSYFYITGGTSLSANTLSPGYIKLADYPSSTNDNSYTIDILNPFLTKFTNVSTGSFLRPSDNYSMFIQGAHQSATSCDGFRIYPGSGTITGTIKVYGYK